ncbi:MAG: DUF2249 domain-containing protein [Aquabacterium sp.]|nr:DUF2249 domain-containing protein [Aquabacterium sp.]
MTTATAAANATIDVRQVPPRERHSLIFATFDRLPSGGALELVNDHDPQPLRGQFEALMPTSYEWAYLESGPETWRVRITKKPDTGHCCGGCCGR